MSDCIPITRFDQRRRSVNATDRSLEVWREFYLEPYEAYPEVLEFLLGRPECSASLGGPLIQPPRRDPFHLGLIGTSPKAGGAIYCHRVEVDHLPSDISTAAGPESTDDNGFPVFNPVTMEAAASASSCQEQFKGAFIKAWYKERPEWSIDINPTSRHFSIPDKMLKWQSLYTADLDFNGNLVLGQQLAVGREGLQGGTEAVKIDTYMEFVVTPRRLFSNQFGNTVSPNPPTLLNWGALQGRVNDSRSLYCTLRGNDGRALQTFNFPAGCLKYEGFRPRVDLTSLSPQYDPTYSGTNSPYPRTDDDNCPVYHIAYDYWDHSHIFTFKSTAELSYTAIRGFTQDSGFNGAPSVPAEVTLYYPGWNRFYYPGNVNAATFDADGNVIPAVQGIWDRVVWPNSDKPVYADEAEIVVGGRKGFELLF